MTRARIAKVSTLAAVGALLLSSCGTHPGNAAVVGDQAISQQRVDDVAAALCAANAGGAASQGQELASRGARQGALQVLLDSELSRQFGQARGVQANQQQVSRAVTQNQQAINALPPKDRDAFRSALQGYAEGQLMLVEIGRRYLSEHGQPNASETQAIAAGRQLRAEYARKLNIQVDPRFGSFNQAKGTLAGSSGSLSVATSQRATGGDTANPSAAWVAQLPATQKCS